MLIKNVSQFGFLSEYVQKVNNNKKVVTLLKQHKTLEQQKIVSIFPDALSKSIMKFDHAFPNNTTQKQFFQPFEESIRKIIEGYNMTVLAYGQTGSGKTHTMFGKERQNSEILHSKDQDKIQNSSRLHSEGENESGLIQRSIQFLFKQIQNENYKNNCSMFNIYCSFLQIYNEKVYDLLQDSQKQKPLEIHQSNQDGFFVEGLTQFKVSKDKDCLKLIKIGRKNSSVRRTLMNAKSSRSHTIFQVYLESLNPDENGLFKKARLTLCDLAGSQKVNKGQKMKQQHLQELKNINKSLTTLGKVISSLSSKSKQIYAPFRQSKLTRLLQQSLTGNSHTFIIGTISPSQLHLQETINTLRFVEKARHIVMKVQPMKFQENNGHVVYQLQKEIINLRKLLKLKNKGINPQEIQEKNLELQQQNQKLKRNFVSAKDYTKVVADNHRMRQEINKLHLMGHLKTDMGYISKHKEINHLRSQESPLSDQNKTNIDSKKNKISQPKKISYDSRVLKKLQGKNRCKSQTKNKKDLQKSHLPQIKISKRKREISESYQIGNKSHLHKAEGNRKNRYSEEPCQDNVKVRRKTFAQQIGQEIEKAKINQLFTNSKLSPQFLDIKIQNFSDLQLDQQQAKNLGVKTKSKRRFNSQRKKLTLQQSSQSDLKSHPQKTSKKREKQLILQKLSQIQSIEKMNQQKLFKDLEYCEGKSSIILPEISQSYCWDESNESTINSQKKIKKKERKGRLLVRQNYSINFEERIKQLQAKIKAK